MTSQLIKNSIKDLAVSFNSFNKNITSFSMNIILPISQLKHFTQMTCYLKHIMKKGPNVTLRKYDNHLAIM